MAASKKARRRGNGEGSVYRRESDGLYVATFSSTDRFGRTKRRVFYGASQHEALAKRQDFTRRQAQGLTNDPNRATVEQMIDRMIEAKRLEGRAAGTIERYVITSRAYLLPYIGRLRVQALSEAHITNLYDELLTRGKSRWGRGTGGLAPKTVRVAHAVLRLALDEAVKLRIIPQNRAPRKVSQRSVTEIRPLTTEEARRLLHAAESRGDPLAAMWRLMADSGCRIGEAAGLRWGRIDFDRGRVSFTHQLTVRVEAAPSFAPLKTRSALRTISLATSTLDALAARKPSDASADDLVFRKENGFCVTKDYARVNLERSLAAAKLPRIRIHDLRHTCATMLLTLGVNPKVVSQRLGHSSVAITLTTYSHVMPTVEEQVAGAIEAALGEGPSDGASSNDRAATSVATLRSGTQL